MTSIVVGRAAAVEDLVRVPGTGQSIPRRCILEVPNGATHDYDSIPARLPAGCNGEQLRSPSVQIYAADTHLKSSEALTSFTADWVVPPLPKRAGGQVVYFWPGFKNSKPEMGYPVLQPVLQYGEHGPGWQLQSWFVDANDHKYPVVTAPAITVEPGHQITSFMPGEITVEWNTVCQPPREEQKSAWGFSKSIKYENAGWPCAEYAVSRMNKNIANSEDEPVRRVEAACVLIASLIR